MIEKYFLSKSIEDAINLYEKYSPNAKIISGGTDLMLEIEKGQHKEISVLIDISRVPDLDYIHIDQEDYIHIGLNVTHSHCIRSEIIEKYGNCLLQACSEVGSPQIRNRGTIVGNLVTASPANDTISALISLDASVKTLSVSGSRFIKLQDFYTGVRKTVLNPGEIVLEIIFKGLSSYEKSIYQKYGLRKAQAISLINLSIVIELEDNIVKNSRISLGAVAPVVIRAEKTEQFIKNKSLTSEMIASASELVVTEIDPISDIRASKEYRNKIVKVLLKRGLESIKNNQTNKEISKVTLWGLNRSPGISQDNKFELSDASKISININGKDLEFSQVVGKSLLHLLRENAFLTGTKEGCGEGECGACTIYMNDKAVLACLIPAASAHASKIETIEGLNSNKINTMQQAFIDEGAIQCGFCTPGFIMSSQKLLEENHKPTEIEIKTAISGNLCRCTGYYKIVRAIEKAAQTFEV